MNMNGYGKNPKNLKDVRSIFRKDKTKLENSSKIDISGEKGRSSQSIQLLSIIEDSNVELFHDQYHEPYARVKQNDRFECFKIRSKNFARWICNKYWNLFAQAVKNEALKSALIIIEGKACYEGYEYNLENRISYNKGEIFYDLGDWTAVKISIKGWEILSKPPILFRSYNHQKTQVIPEKCIEGKEQFLLDDLLCLINIKNTQHKLLFLVGLHCLFIPHIPRPIFVLHGDQGTAKTTTSTLIKELVDPSKLKNLRIGNGYGEFIQQAGHHYLLCLDNLSSLPTWMSDTLCRLVTGEGFSKRELYTNDEDVIYSFKRCIILNGINLVPNKPDLLDRCLIFELAPILKKDRIDESIFWESFSEMNPKILGAIFSTISKAMRIYPTIQLNYKPRMADFAKWGAAIAEALGYSTEEFINAYNENISIQNAEALEANPIAKVIINFMVDRAEWNGSATDLFHELKDVADDLLVDTKDKRFPNDPRWLWRRIKEVKPNLKSIGIIIEKDDRNHAKGRQINIRNSAIEESRLYNGGISDVHTGRDSYNIGQQDNTDIILDKLLEDDYGCSNEHSDACDCEVCISGE